MEQLLCPAHKNLLLNSLTLISSALTHSIKDQKRFSVRGMSTSLSLPVSHEECFVVVRHSERIDESHPKEWEDIIKATYPLGEREDGGERKGKSARGIAGGGGGGGKMTPRVSTTTAAKSGNGGKDSLKLPPIPHSTPSSSGVPPPVRRGSHGASGTLKTSPRIGAPTPPSNTASFSHPHPPQSSLLKIKKRKKACFISDPPLSTTNGPIYANHAAETIATLLLNSTSSSSSSSSSSTPLPFPIRLYSSRLRRCIQTAAPIACKLNLPIYLSYGLSMIINAVRKVSQTNPTTSTTSTPWEAGFEFLSTEDLERDFPGIIFISCDNLRDYPQDYLPTHSWIEALHAIIRNGSPLPTSSSTSTAVPLNIIVGHRETLRGIAGEHVSAPYCAIGIFRKTPSGGLGDEVVEEDEEDVGGSGGGGGGRKGIKKPSSSLPPSGKSKGNGMKQTGKGNGKNRSGPLYPLLQLYDCRGRSLMK